MARDASELLEGLSDEDAAGVKALGSSVRLSAGGALFRLGGEADHLYLITRGRVALSLPMRVGGHEEEVLVEERLRVEQRQGQVRRAAVLVLRVPVRLAQRDRWIAPMARRYTRLRACRVTERAALEGTEVVRRSLRVRMSPSKGAVMVS